MPKWVTPDQFAVEMNRMNPRPAGPPMQQGGLPQMPLPGGNFQTVHPKEGFRGGLSVDEGNLDQEEARKRVLKMLLGI